MAAHAAAASTNTSQPNTSQLLPAPVSPPHKPPLPQSSSEQSQQQQQQQLPQQSQSRPQQLTSSTHPLLPALSPTNFPPSVSSTSPSKASLANWWKGFKAKPLFRKGEEQEVASKGIFGVSLNTSIRYAYVNISITNPNGDSEVYGRIPIIVAKCGVFLKDKATDVEGIFRVSGSAKRIKELQTIFDSPPTFGKTLDWEGFNVHDAANVFRRYINHLPEPIIPHDYYFAFRKPLEVETPDVEQTVRKYQKLIGDLPKLNGQLLLYILDLLAVFAENASQNLMPAANLAAIFQPGLLSHPDHDMNPQEYRVSQEVLVFLIEHQDRFLPTSASLTRERSPARPQPTSKLAAAPPATLAASRDPSREVTIPRRHTLTKKSDTGPMLSGKMLRRHRSSRTPHSPKLSAEEEEPRRVSEGSAPTGSSGAGTTEETAFPIRNITSEISGQDAPLEQGGEVVSLPSVIRSTGPAEAADPDLAESTTTTEPPTNVDSPIIVQSEDNSNSEPTQSEEVAKSTNHDGISKGTLLSVSSGPVGRSSSYREELDEVIEYQDQTTSADNTEGDTSDGQEKSGKKKQRKSRLPWSSNSDLPSTEGNKLSNLFSITAAAVGQDGRPVKKLKKRRLKDTGGHLNAIGIALSVARPESLKSPDSEHTQSERDFKLVSPKRWTEQSNLSQSSLNASEFSRRSHISSNHSSVEIRRSVTPIDRSLAPPTTFEAIQANSHMNLPIDNNDLPTRVVIPAARAENPLASSQSSTHSAASSKGSKIGSWLRKKRGVSISSSSAGGAPSEVSD